MSSSPSEKEETPIVQTCLMESDYLKQPASQSLRVSCYGSSSPKTPEKYLQEARALGYILARRGHVCVNGAGSFGCMAAMNAGAASGNGHIVGVIHEMFVVDGGDWSMPNGGAHQVFRKPAERDGPIRELLVAGGDNLQERKRLLVKGANALVVLPGGPGTWDELWEMACARNIGLTTLPIVCVNVDGYYESFRQMLERAYKDDLIKVPPKEILHFEPTAEAAVRWLEEQQAEKAPPSARPRLKTRDSTLGRSSFMAPPVGDWSFGFDRKWENGKLVKNGAAIWGKWALTFGAGVAVGVIAASQMNRAKA